MEGTNYSESSCQIKIALNFQILSNQVSLCLENFLYSWSYMTTVGHSDLLIKLEFRGNHRWLCEGNLRKLLKGRDVES